MRHWVVLVGCAVSAIVFGALALREGEVVTLTSVDAGGRALETELWVVESDRALFVRAADGEAAWLEHIRSTPRVKLARQGRESELRAIPVDDPDARRRVNRAMADKYGALDRVAAFFHDPARSVPVRLEPLAAGIAGAAAHPGDGGSAHPRDAGSAHPGDGGSARPGGGRPAHPGDAGAAGAGAGASPAGATAGEPRP